MIDMGGVHDRRHGWSLIIIHCRLAAVRGILDWMHRYSTKDYLALVLLGDKSLGLRIRAYFLESCSAIPCAR